ncbi:signal peptide peptidase SppA [bacterium]|nr:signal peptide peptidase SppA [bacterium]
MKFLKTLLASILGTILAGVLLFLIFVGIIAGIASSGDKKVKLDEKNLLVINLNTQIVERTEDDPFSQLIGSFSDGPGKLGLNNILKNIEKAKRDENILGIYLECGAPSTGFATIEEIRNAIIDFKTAGKFVYSFAATYSQKGYYLASVSDKVYLNPEGMLIFQGLSSSSTFLKGALDKLGIEMQVFKHGKFKSAVEPYLLDKMSEPAKEQTRTYLGSIWNHTLKKIAESRPVTVEQLIAVAEESTMFMENQILVDNKIIDGLKYKDEVIDELKELTETKQKDDIPSITLGKYSNVFLAGDSKGLLKDKIAVIYAVGGIDTGSEGIQSDDLSRTIRKARRDSNIKAVVLRINSPGGSGLGSEIILREVKLCRDVKPVIVSMGDYAASGGYYIACMADTIVAHSNTLTGSIGVFGVIPNTKKMFKKIGVTFDGVKTNTFADMPSITRPFNSNEKDLLQAHIERFYKVFIGRCAEGRSTTPEAINEIGQGRVWSGDNALEIKLVDVIGGLNTAIKIAKEKANIKKYRLIEMPEMLSPMDEFMKNMSGETKAYIENTFLGEEYKYLKTIKEIKSTYPIQARMPYEIEIQ